MRFSHQTDVLRCLTLEERRRGWTRKKRKRAANLEPEVALRRGILFVLSGASGVGKGTILKMVLARETNLEFSVSWTTREQRKGEMDGKDYYFKTRPEFEAELNHPDGGGFLEHAEFVGQLYGTPRRWIEEKLSQGVDVILDIELDGAMQIARSMPEAVLIMVVPPNLSVLRERLMRRGTETIEKMRVRLERAVKDMQKYRYFHYLFENGELATGVDDLLSVIRAERLRTSRIDPDVFAIHSSKDATLEAKLDDAENAIRQSGVR